MTGDEIFNIGNKHKGEPYILGSQVSKNNKLWKGPWDCAEFVSIGLPTLKAVEAFQQANDLVVDGEVGRDTGKALVINL